MCEGGKAAVCFLQAAALLYHFARCGLAEVSGCSFPGDISWKLSFFCYSGFMQSVWTVEFLDDAVEAEFFSIPKDLQARLVRITDLIESTVLRI